MKKRDYCYFVSKMGILLISILISNVAMAQTKNNVTLNLNNVSIRQLFNAIQKQTGYDYLISSDLAKQLPKISVKSQNEPVHQVLSRVFTPLKCKFEIQNGVISVFLEPSKVRIRKLSGYVHDENGEPLIGVPIRIDDSKVITITDNSGHYSLNVPTKSCNICFSYVGMQTVYMNLEAGKNTVHQNIILHDNTNLDEVMVTGYQTISRERATGSYSIINKDELQKRHSTDVSSALDGLVAGMQGEDNNRGGKNFTIRGTGTFLADANPLIVVDGFPIMNNSSNGAAKNPNLNALERINPDDIESITVLKDAAAASIWGARSANGVIVITTKKGKKGQPFSVDINSQLSISNKQNVRYLTNYATSAQTINYQRWAFENGMIGEEYTGNISDLYNSISPSLVLLYKGYRWGAMTKEEMNKQLAVLAALDNTKQIKDKLLQTPIQSSTSATISGGINNWTTRASIEYIYSKGDFISRQDNNWKIDWNNNYRFNKHAALNIALNLVQNNRHSSQKTLSDISELSPYEMLLNDDGSYATDYHNTYNSDVLGNFNWKGFTYSDMNYNLLQEARTRLAHNVNTQFRTQVGLEIDILDGLQFNSKFQYETSHYHLLDTNQEESFYTRMAINNYTPGDGEGNAIGNSSLPAGAIIIDEKGDNDGLLFRNDFSLNKTFNAKHDVAAVLGNEVSNYWYRSHIDPYKYGVTKTSSSVKAPYGFVPTMDGSESAIPGVPDKGKKYVSQTWNHNRYVSFYGNISYMYDERYGISVSARSDASNLITSKAKYRWSPLWSVGGMWNLNNESWLKKNPVLNRLTLRLTYGQNGNAASSSSARTTINTSSSKIDEYTGRYIGTIFDYGNSSLRWEKTAITNLGIDFSLLNDAFYGSIDYYYKRSKDVLGNVAISSVNGTSNAVANNAEITNHGIEITLGGNQTLGAFILGARLTYAYNKNKVTKLNSDVSTLSDFLNATYVQGYSMSPMFRFTYGGLKNGIPTVVSKDGTKYSIDNTSIYFMSWKDFLSYKGTSVSPHTASLNLSLGWKTLTFNAYFNARFGGKIQMPTFNYEYPDLYSGKIIPSSEISSLMNADGSVIKNPYKVIPLPTVDDKGNTIDIYTYSVYSQYSSSMSMNVESAAYIYFSELDLDWNIPKKWIKNLPFKGINVFGKLENIGLLWAANSCNYYPEYIPGNYKPALTFSIGANVKF